MGSIKSNLIYTSNINIKFAKGIWKIKQSLTITRYTLDITGHSNIFSLRKIAKLNYIPLLIWKLYDSNLKYSILLTAVGIKKMQIGRHV